MINTEQSPLGGDSAYERGGEARRKFWIKPLKETDLGVAQAFLILTPKRDHVKAQTIYIVGFHMTSLKFKLQNYRSYRDFTFTMY